MKTLILAVFLLSIAANAQSVFRFNGQCTLDTTDVTTAPAATTLISNACTVTVFETGTATLATLCSDDLASCTSLSNPFNAAATGRFNFYVEPGNFDIQLTGGTPSIGTVTITDEFIGQTAILVGTVSGVGTLDAQINAAVAKLTSGGTITVTASGTTTADININQTDITLECLPGVTITRGYNGAASNTQGQILLNANGGRLLNCTIDGNLASFPNAFNNAVNVSADDILIQGNTFLNTERWTIIIMGSSRIEISHNTFKHNADNDDSTIFMQQDVFDVNVSSNWMECEEGCIIGHITTTTQNVDRIEIIGNNMGNHSAFCVEMGGFTGTLSDVARYITISGNNCRQIGTTGGGYSLSTAANVAVTGNTFFGNSSSPASLAIELVLCDYCTVSGNTIQFGRISLDASNDSVVVGNYVRTWSTTTATGGIGIKTLIAGRALSNNLVANNFLVAPATGTVRGIDYGCSVVSDCFNNSLIGNTIIGNGQAQGTTFGIIITDSGVGDIAGLTVKNNTIVDWVVGIQDSTSNTPTDVEIGGNSYSGNLLAANTLSVNVGTGHRFKQAEIAFAKIDEIATADDGSTIICTDCAPGGSPCVGSGTGSFAVLEAGAWDCK